MLPLLQHGFIFFLQFEDASVSVIRADNVLLGER